MRPVSPWSVAKSFFAPYKFDTAALLNKCFEFDWKCSSLNRMIKDPDANGASKEYLRSKYPIIREAYKHLACVAPSGNIASIGQNVMTGLMLDSNDFIDYKIMKLSDIDLAFIATNAIGSKSFPFKQEECNNPERQLIRFQFMEIITRLSLERFAQKGPKVTQPKAIEMMMDQYIGSTLGKYNSHNWRTEKYWTEENDKVINANM